MTENSLWLGPLRRPVRMAMIVCGAIVAALYVWIIISQFFSAEPIGMHEMIRPEGRPLVQAVLISLALALFFAALYTSDERGAIEIEHAGFFDIFSLICGRLAMFSVGFVVIVMMYEVIARYIFNAPTLWANELSLWIASFVFLLAGLYAMQQRSHIRIYVIYDMMPRWMQKSADTLSVLLIWFFTFCLIWGGYNNAMRRFMRMEGFGTAWDPPINGTVQIAILIVVFMVALQATSNLIADWNKAPEHHTPADEIDEEEIAKIRATLEDKH